jgi:hypothetical protein
MLMLFPGSEKEVQAATKVIGLGMGFERTRRITGYLVGTLDRFNNAKRAEEKDRIKHDA